jgi:hypothetical protein
VGPWQLLGALKILWTLEALEQSKAELPPTLHPTTAQAGFLRQVMA